MSQTSSGFSSAEYRTTQKSVLSAAPLDLAGGAQGDALYAHTLDAQAELYELLGVAGFLTQDVGAATTLGSYRVRVTPANGDPAYFLQNDPSVDPLNNAPFEGKLDIAGLQGDHHSLNLNKFGTCRNRAEEYPELKAGDLLELVKEVPGVGGAQTLRVQFIYRILGEAPDLRFYGQYNAGVQFVGDGNEYPFGNTIGQAEGYPNFGRKCDEV